MDPNTLFWMVIGWVAVCGIGAVLGLWLLWQRVRNIQALNRRQITNGRRRTARGRRREAASKVYAMCCYVAIGLVVLWQPSFVHPRVVTTFCFISSTVFFVVDMALQVREQQLGLQDAQKQAAQVEKGGG